MKLKKSFFLYTILGLLVLAGCKHNETPEEPPKYFSVKFFDEETLVKEFSVQENTKVSKCNDWNIVKKYTEDKEDLLLVGWYTSNDVLFKDEPVNADAKYYALWAPVSIETDDSYAVIKWKENDELSNCTVQVKDGENVVATKTNCNGYAEFFGLTNDIEYTFVVTSGFKSESIKGTPSITVKETDWVVAMYMDGDNDLHDSIFCDLNEVEYGLWKMENSDKEFDSVSIVALWDGWTGSSSKQPMFKCGDKSYLYEFGPEESIQTDANHGHQVIGDTLEEYNVFGNIAISETTKNLSYTAKDWLFGTSVDIEDLDASVGGEVDMGKKQTLVNYINWVNARYKPTKGIILQFSDHGGGPRNAPEYAKLQNGKTIKLDTDGRKALCWDENSASESFLKTSDVSNALDELGYGPGNKVDMILMDVCLGASVEDAYQFKDYADYFIASPNTISGTGMNYIRFMESFVKGTNIKEIGIKLIKDFKYFYQGQQWDKIAKFMSEDDNPITSYNQLTDSEKINVELIYGGLAGVSTLSFVDLNKVDSLVSAIDNLAQTLLSKDGETLYFTDDNYSRITDEETEYSRDYLDHLRRILVSWQECDIYNDNALFYKGTYTWLYDIGVLARTLDAIIDDDEIETAVNNVKTALGNAIISCWRDTNLTRDSEGNICPGDDYQDYGYYALLDSNKTGDYSGHKYGLTIAGYGYIRDEATGKLIVPGPVYPWYDTELKFGEDTKWSELLRKMKAYAN